MKTTTAESVIRQMTRLAVRHRAVNLAQGFTDEAPPYPMVWAAITSLLGGTDEGIDGLTATTVDDLGSSSVSGASPVTVEKALESFQNRHDVFNQYSYPFGLTELREAIADYTARRCGFRPDPETETTVVLGATEGLASVLAALGAPGEGVIIPQPFHEMYPSQAGVFGLRPIYLTLTPGDGRWSLDLDELDRAASDRARLLVLNTPHNPTGKVFTEAELAGVAEVAVAHDLVVVMDEIYEQITYDGSRHVALAAMPGMRDRTVMVNSISKTGNATGWRIGWVVASERYTPQIRGVHDTLVIQAPTPLQKAAVRLLSMPDPFFDELRQRYAVKRRVLRDGLQAVGFEMIEPQGAYYLFADYRGVKPLGAMSSMEAAIYLIEQIGVATVPGDNFYATTDAPSSHLRFAFCRSLPALEEAVQRLRRLV